MMHLDFMEKKRTKDGKGVTIASQIRYIGYYERVVRQMGGVIPVSPPLTLTLINVECFPKKTYPNAEPFISIEINDEVTFQSETGTVEKKGDEYHASIRVMGKVEGDIKIQLSALKKQSLCHFWFNTGFVDNKLELTKPGIDVANKDKKCKVFKDDFKVTLFFKEYDPEDIVNGTETDIAKK